MSETRFTPGPWRFITGYIMGSDGVGPYGPREVQVGTVGAYRDSELLPFNKERWDADGALIAAAPALYEALNEAINYVAVMAATLGDHSHAAVLDKATAALSKANPPEK
jgi:hypothetical protein